jgi:hypothetical protein
VKTPRRGAALSVQQKRRVAGLRRPRSPLVAPRHDALRCRLQALTAEHPVGGYRRLWAYLRFVEQRPVHKPRVRRLRREQRWLVPPNRTLQATRTPTGREPRATQPNEWWGIDMTKSLVEDCGWVSIVVVLDW